VKGRDQKISQLSRRTGAPHFQIRSGANASKQNWETYWSNIVMLGPVRANIATLGPILLVPMYRSRSIGQCWRNI